MKCPKCGGENVSVQAVTETKSKTRWGCGCLFTWLAFLFPKHVSKTHTEAVCQNCGKRWKVTNADVRRANSAPRANTEEQPSGNIKALASSAIEALKSKADEPFYKSMWFFVLVGLIFPIAALIMIFTIHKDWDRKKQIIAAVILAVWTLCTLPACFGGNSDAVSATDAPASVTVSSVEVLTINVDGKDAGAYGKEITLNADADMPNTYIGYYFPAGTYTATNFDANYPVQIELCSDETTIDGGWEYPADVRTPIVLQPNESAEISAENGYYIKVIGSESGASVRFEHK